MCKKCAAKASAKWKESTDYYNSNQKRLLAYKRKTYDRVRKKNYDLQFKYGITLVEFNTLLRDQNYKCKTCGHRIYSLSSKQRYNYLAVVDHCHQTGKVRGLLCHNCNRAIGLMLEDWETIAIAAEYVRLQGQV